MLPIAAKGRILSQTPAAQARRAATRRGKWQPNARGKPSDQPVWLTEQVYVERIQPLLAKFSASKVALAIGVSAPYAVAIRAARCRPHPRHWATLALLTGG
jgi:hypothetical protein